MRARFSGASYIKDAIRESEDVYDELRELDALAVEHGDSAVQKAVSDTICAIGAALEELDRLCAKIAWVKGVEA
jgi:hypothetical protein